MIISKMDYVVRWLEIRATSDAGAAGNDTTFLGRESSMMQQLPPVNQLWLTGTIKLILAKLPVRWTYFAEYFQLIVLSRVINLCSMFYSNLFKL